MAVIVDGVVIKRFPREDNLIIVVPIQKINTNIIILEIISIAIFVSPISSM